jgi:hypothetical protein
MGTMFGDPEIVSGARGSVVDRSAGENRKTGTLDLKMARAAAVLHRAGGLPVYMSNTSRLNILIAAGREFVDGNGRRRDLPSIRARFNYGLYIPSSGLRKGSPEWKEEIDLIVQALETHPKMGLGRLFWRADAALAADKERRYSEAVSLLKEDADLKERFLAEVTAEEMDAAVVHTQNKRKEAIEAARGTEKFKPVAPASREDIMERAAASRDKLAKKMRKQADEEEEIIAPAPEATPKKKKKHRLGL